MTTTPKELEWEKELERIMDKNITNLTKTGDKDFNPPEIISFDTVVFEKYDATVKLKEFIQFLLSQSVNETIKKVEEIVKKLSGIYQIGDYENEPSAINKKDLLSQLSELKIKEKK